MTGLWQVEARDNPSFHTYERLDLFYVDNWSIGLDLTILVATAESELARVAKRLFPRARPHPDRARRQQIALAVRARPGPRRIRRHRASIRPASTTTHAANVTTLDTPTTRQ
jgi:hypothetical protein